MNTRSPLFIILLLAQTVAVAEEDPWALCSAWSFPAFQLRMEDLPSAGQALIAADQVLSQDEVHADFLGNVEMLRADDQFQTEALNYDYAHNLITLDGDIRYRGRGSVVYADSAVFKAADDPALQDALRFEEADFFLLDSHINGHAKRFERSENDITTLHNASYSSCDPGRTDWQFKASEIRLDHAQGFGQARHTRLYFKRVPLFYFPWFSFPIDDRRKSGFLVPAFGRSNNRGTELTVPYYWNIAPNADATLALHNMTARGPQLITEWRYMNRWSANQLNAEYLNDQRLGESREFYRFTHKGRLTGGWRTALSYPEVSDPDYYRDGLADRLADKEEHFFLQQQVRQLQRQASLSTSSEHWHFKAGFMDFLSLDREAGSPYAYKPQFLLEGEYYELPGGIDYRLRTELTAFEHDSKASGARLDIQPRFSRVFGDPGWFFIPSISARHSQYQLDEDSSSSEMPDKLNRTLPLVSLDSGLFLERDLGDAGRYRQTLEPRIFYLYAPYRAQADIPLVDTRELDFSFAQLFRENRFTGMDRVNDANQISVAVSTRFLKTTSGEELFRASIGQTFYFEDRRVALSGEVLQTEAKSDLAAEIAALINNRWRGSLSVAWDPEEDEINKGVARLRYLRDNRHIVNFGYRYRRDILQQAEIALRWPLSRRWTSVAKWQYSLLDQHDLETFAGFEYESCCYIFRFMGRRYLNEEEYDTEVFLQFSFKGFTDFGDNAGRFLEQSLAGYEDHF